MSNLLMFLISLAQLGFAYVYARRGQRYWIAANHLYGEARRLHDDTQKTIVAWMEDTKSYEEMRVAGLVAEADERSPEGD